MDAGRYPRAVRSSRQDQERGGRWKTMDTFLKIYGGISSRAVAGQNLERYCATFDGHCDGTKWAVGRHYIRALTDFSSTRVVREARNSCAAFIAEALLGLVAERPKLVCVLRVWGSLEPGASRALCFGASEECNGTLSIIFAVSVNKVRWTRG